MTADGGTMAFNNATITNDAGATIDTGTNGQVNITYNTATLTNNGSIALGTGTLKNNIGGQMGGPLP